jgi:hypothetical protein
MADNDDDRWPNHSVRSPQSGAAGLATRIQLSLYVPAPVGTGLDKIRRRLDPIQAGLIPAHVTLAREDELADLAPAALGTRFAAPQAAIITLGFGPAEPFQGHGLLLPCTRGEADFDALRRWLLGSHWRRRQAPHITLAHPRNPKSAGHDIAIAQTLARELIITFTEAWRSRQVGSDPWQPLEQYPLGGAR